MGPQTCRSPNFGSFETFGTKCHLGVAPVAVHKIYYKGGRWCLPPSSGRGESCESVFARGSSMHLNRSNYALTNLLFGLCRSVWVIDVCHSSQSYPGAPTCPSTPKVLRAKECAPIPYFSIVFTSNSHLNLLRSLGVHKKRPSFVGWQSVVIIT
jgi:hypothetical protein